MAYRRCLLLCTGTCKEISGSLHAKGFSHIRSLDKGITAMKRKKVFMLIIVMLLLSLCTACAEEISSSDGEKEEECVTRVSPVRLDFCTEKQVTKIEDGTILSTKKYIYPVVVIEENETVADKINADIQERVNSFRADTFVLDSAEESYAFVKDNPEYRFDNYFDELVFTAARVDSKVISFLVTKQYWTGGGHVQDNYIGLNYDTQTGELIKFADLSEHADALGQDTLTFLQNPAYQGILWSDSIFDDLQEVVSIFIEIIKYQKNIADLRGVPYQDNEWYFSTSGLVLFCCPNPGTGIIELIVSYSDLEEIGLKEKYDREGIRTIQLKAGEVDSSDLNGDGQDEDILYYMDGNRIGSAETNVCLIIDGIDYAVELEELSRQFSNDDYIYCRVKCFLYKMDKTDTATEIAFEMNYTSLEEDFVIPNTFCYRYEGNGILTYLGRMEGTITDPMTGFHIMSGDNGAAEK